MKIAVLTQYFAPEMGAPQSRLLEMAKGLQRNGWDVRVFTALPNYPTGKIFNDYKGRLGTKDEVQGIPVYRYWLYPSNSKKTLPRIASMLSFSFTSAFSFAALKRFKPDYIVVESPPLTLAYTGYLLSRTTGAKLVLNISDLWPLTARELGAISDGFMYRQLEKLEHFLYRKAYFSMGQSQQIVDHIGANGGKKVYLFRNGVDPNRFKPIDKPENTDQTKLVYAGLLGVAQDILQICREVDFTSRNIHFHIYGSGAQRQELEKYIQSHPEKNITLHEPLPRDKIAEILPTFDGTIIPLKKSLYGAVPSKIYEAMAAGLPILFAGGGEGEELVLKYKCGWVSPPADTETLQQNILDFMTNDSKRREYRENCLWAANNVFNRNKQIEDLHEYFYNDLKSNG